MNYFAYGSNMNPQRMLERDVHFSDRTVALLSGWEMRFNKISRLFPGYGGANINVSERGCVEGFVYTIPDADIDKLDLFEGYPNHYRRELVTVQDKVGTLIEVITYIAQPDKVRESLSSHPEYLNHILLGARMGLSTGYINDLEAM